jgi:purine nucleoside permease
LEAAIRAHLVKKVDYGRFMMVRCVSDYDRFDDLYCFTFVGLTVFSSCRGPSGSDQFQAFLATNNDEASEQLATRNCWNGAKPVIQAVSSKTRLIVLTDQSGKQIVSNWHEWEAGVPPQKGFYGDILGTINAG